MLNNPTPHNAASELSASRPPFVVSGAVEGFENEPTPSYLLRSAVDHESHAAVDVEGLD